MISQNNVLLIRRIFLVLFVLFLTINVGADSITVFVKDQNGDNVYDNPHLISPLKIEVFKENQIIKNETFPSNKDNLSISVPQTGPYIVRAFTTLEYFDRDSCYANYSGSKGPKCADVCPQSLRLLDLAHGVESTTDFFYELEASDDRGPYTCKFLDCYEGPGELGADQYGAWDCSFDRRYRYVVSNEVLTYVDLNESDRVQVSLPTGFDGLGKYGNLFGDRSFNVSDAIPEIRAKNPIGAWVVTGQEAQALYGG
jgi:hypothetical protein